MGKRREFCINCGATGDLYGHHVVPRFLGGTDRPSNIVKLCGDCHAIVHDVRKMSVRLFTVQALKDRKDNMQAYGRTPYGYDKRKGFLISNESEQAIIKRIFKERSKGKTYDQIMSGLNKDKVKTKLKGKWHASTIRYILTNDLYKENKKTQLKLIF